MQVFRAKSTQKYIDFALKIVFSGEIYLKSYRFRPERQILYPIQSMHNKVFSLIL